MKNLLKYYARYNLFFKNELRRIDSLSALSVDQLENLKEKACISLFKRAFNKSSFYREFYLNEGIEEGDIASMEHFQNIPILTKELIRTNLDSLITKPKLTLIKGYTSGTTGSPLTTYRDWMSIITENAYVWNYRINKGLSPGDWKLSIRGDYNKDVILKINKSERTIFLSSYNLSNENRDIIIDAIVKYKPKALVGYPSSLHILSELLGDAALDFEISLAFTSSEVLHQYQRSIIESSFGLKIFDWYGNSERTIALQQNGNYYEEPPLYSHNEYHDDFILTTGLINDSFPLIRYRVPDRVTFSGQQLSEKELIIGIEGRSDDYITTSNGKIGSPGISTSFKGLDDIIMCQLIQKELDYIQVKVVIERKNERSISILKNRLKERLGADIGLGFLIVDKSELEVGRNGKVRLIISEINQNG